VDGMIKIIRIKIKKKLLDQIRSKDDSNQCIDPNTTTQSIFVWIFLLYTSFAKRKFQTALDRCKFRVLKNKQNWS